jgi:hypothetical protein
MATTKTEPAFGWLHTQARSFACPSSPSKRFFSLSEQALHTGSLPTYTTLKPVSSLLQRSKIRLSLVTHYLKESLFVGRKGRKKSRADVCLVGNGCQDRTACERERQEKPHNQDLYCGLWPAHRLQKQILRTESPCTFKAWDVKHTLQRTVHLTGRPSIIGCFW